MEYENMIWIVLFEEKRKKEKVPGTGHQYQTAYIPHVEILIVHPHNCIHVFRDFLM